MDLNTIHKCLMGLSKRAERVTDEKLVQTFVDVEPLFDMLNTENHQVLFGRRGTGKTHALKYLGDQAAQDGGFVVYIDLRTVGSNNSIYSDAALPIVERATLLLLDVMEEVHDQLLRIAIDRIEKLRDPKRTSEALDHLAEAISTVKIEGTVDVEASREARIAAETGSQTQGNLSADGAALSAGRQRSSRQEARQTTSIRSSGREYFYLKFGAIQTTIETLLREMDASRLWLLVDEWSEIPLELQPYLADLFRRTVLPIPQVTLKVGAIEQRSRLMIPRPGGEYTGMELGADIGADLNLDDFMVFDNDEEKATAFFQTLLFKHYHTADNADPSITSGEQLTSIAFTQNTAFQEFVRAAEGVPETRFT